MKIRLSILFLLGSISIISAQSNFENLDALPVIKGTYMDGVKNDWLIKRPTEKAGIFRNEENNELILSNGIISRTFRLSPNAATTSLKVLSKQKEHIRAIKPEAIVILNGFTINVGGLTGQPNLAFLYPDWLDDLKSDPLAFKFIGFKTSTPEKRLEWNEMRHHAPNADWPPKGVKLQMDYKLSDFSPEALLSLSQASNIGRTEIFHENFATMSDVWTIHKSPTHERSSFFNCCE